MNAETPIITARFEERMVDAGDGRLRSDSTDGAPRNP
jgi:hypothetical protein